jgi:hypothetical protein
MISDEYKNGDCWSSLCSDTVCFCYDRDDMEEPDNLAGDDCECVSCVPPTPVPQRDPADFAGVPIFRGNKPEDGAGVDLPWQDAFRAGVGRTAYLDELDTFKPRGEVGSGKQIIVGDGWSAHRQVCFEAFAKFERTHRGSRIDDSESTLRGGAYSPALQLHLHAMKAQTLLEAKRSMREWPRCYATYEAALPEFSVELQTTMAGGFIPSVTLHFRCPEHNGHHINEYKEA